MANILNSAQKCKINFRNILRPNPVSIRKEIHKSTAHLWHLKHGISDRIMWHPGNTGLSNDFFLLIILSNMYDLVYIPLSFFPLYDFSSSVHVTILCRVFNCIKHVHASSVLNLLYKLYKGKRQRLCKNKNKKT